MLTKIPKFRRCVIQSFPFIEEDFDALTDYELLCKVVEYLNKVITSQNEVVEATEGLLDSFSALQSYVATYFENLDVQEEINNKLDEMAEDGTLQEIITTYIQSNVAWTFDTVADMKLATNLVNGSYAQTLGFHSINDGGNAIYKITESGTANEMDVIACGDLYANLVYGKEINVKKLGSYGDDTHDDYAVFNRAYTIANTNGIVLYAPKATYKIESQLNLKHITINCKGQIDNSSALILGANSNGSTSTKVNINKCNDVQIEGAKNSYFNIDHCEDIVLFANGSINDNTSIAYNKIEGIDCSSITLNGINNGWINENEFNIKRCNGDLIIGGDGSYPHNNNHFNNICIEGNSKHITINYGHNNYITYRGENYPVITLGSDVTKVFGNVIQKQTSSIYSAEISITELNKNNSFNKIGSEYLPTTYATELFSITPNNAKTINSPIYVNSEGKVTGSYADEYICSSIPGNIPFTATLMSDTASHYVYITCYDANGNAMNGNVAGVGIAQNPSTLEYYSSNTQDKISVSYAPTTGVDHVKLRFRIGATKTFNYVVAQLYTPFLNLINLKNEIDQNKKYMNAIPSSVTNLNPTWAVGDVVYNSAPSAGGTIGWICVTAGTPGTWKAFGDIAE